MTPDSQQVLHCVPISKSARVTQNGHTWLKKVPSGPSLCAKHPEVQHLVCTDIDAAMVTGIVLYLLVSTRIASHVMNNVSSASGAAAKLKCLRQLDEVQRISVNTKGGRELVHRAEYIQRIPKGAMKYEMHFCSSRKT